MKGNFLAGRSFTDLDALNREAALWCAEQGGRWRRAAACVPMREHEAACSANTRPLEVTAEVERYLCPRRKISFDGFVSFEGHRYGVPYWYVRRECCMRGLKTYYIKATELRDRFQKAVQRGNTSRVVSSLVKPSCLIVDEVGEMRLRQAVHRPVLRCRRQALREGGAERDGPHEQHRPERVG